MQVIKSILITSLLVFSLCSISDKTCKIREVLNDFENRRPALEKEVFTPETFPEMDLKGVVGKGFKYYRENSEVTKYEGVEAGYLNAFIDYIQDILAMPQQYRGKLGGMLKLVRASRFKQVVSSDIIFAVDSRKDQCKYFNILAQKNKDGSFDFMVGQIQTTFKMAPDVYVITKKDSKSWFGLSHTYEEELVEVPKTISKEGLQKLTQYLEVCIFKNYLDIVNIGPKF